MWDGTWGTSTAESQGSSCDCGPGTWLGDSLPRGLPGDKREFLSWETPAFRFNLGQAVQLLFCDSFDRTKDVLSLRRIFSHVPLLQES